MAILNGNLKIIQQANMNVSRSTGRISPEMAIREYVDSHIDYAKPFIRAADADLIPGKIQRLCERISSSGSYLCPA